ncbi:MAG: ABC transporter permease [Vulcanimicrobiaceae bacterium]
MRALGVLARVALYVYPREFRMQFGDAILADVAADPSHAAAQLHDLLKGGIAMRLDTLFRDLSYAQRRLRSAPLFITIVILTFALGIGANVAVFSVLNAVVLRPLPFTDPSRLVILQVHDPHGDVFPNPSVTDASDIRLQARTLATIAAVAGHQPTLLVDGHPFALDGLDVMPEYFTMLGVEPQLGRLLIPADSRPGVHNVVISDELWHKRWGANQNVLGRTISLDGKAFTVVGILRPGQLLAIPGGESVGSTDFLGALPETGAAQGRGARVSSALARLAPGVTLGQANADLSLVSGRLQRLYPRTDAKWSFSVESLSAAVLGPAASALWIIFAAVVGILLIACANVGNMLGARWSSRDRELAVRRALGASSQRIAGQLFVETSVLAFFGAVFGVALAYIALRSMSGLVSAALPRASSVNIDGTSLLYALLAVVVATLLAGVSPVLSLGTNDLQSVLKSAGRGGDSSRGHRLRSGLVVLEIALALALVVVSGLMVRSFAELVHTPLGIRPDGVVVSAPVAVPAQYDTPSAAAMMQRELLRRLRALPGVDAAALTLMYPLGDIGMEGDTRIAGRTYPPGGAPIAWANDVSPDYFRALGIPIVHGRALTDSDTTGSAPVVIVNETFVKQFLNGENPLGTRISMPPKGRWGTIVGVVGDERQGLTTPPAPEFYAPILQVPQPYISIVLHSSSVAPAAIGHEVRKTFATMMPLVPPPDTFTIAQRVENATAPTRFATMMLGMLALIALLLACAGVFGVMSFSVTQRLREFGIRIALGASARDIVIDVLRRTLFTTAVGVAAGLAIAAVAARAISSQLNSVSPFDPATFAIVIALIFASSVLASLHPAVRATRVEPVAALRYE